MNSSAEMVMLNLKIEIRDHCNQYKAAKLVRIQCWWHMYTI